MFEFSAIIVALLAIGHTTLAGILPIRSCPGVPTVGHLQYLVVPSCEEPPCILKKGNTYSVEIDFDVFKNTTNLDVTVTGIIGGIELPWNGVGKVGCNDMVVGKCPLYEFDYVTYGVNLTVLEMYPSVSLDIKWKMQDDRGDTIWCFLLAASIRT